MIVNSLFSQRTHVLPSRFQINQMTENPNGLVCLVLSYLLASRIRYAHVLMEYASRSHSSHPCRVRQWTSDCSSICIVRLPQCQNPSRALHRRSSLNRVRSIARSPIHAEITHAGTSFEVSQSREISLTRSSASDYSEPGDTTLNYTQ